MSSSLMVSTHSSDGTASSISSPQEIMDMQMQVDTSAESSQQSQQSAEEMDKLLKRMNLEKVGDTFDHADDRPCMCYSRDWSWQV
jgi:hypothetical protein